MRVAILQAGAVDESLALADLAGELVARRHDVRLFLDAQEADFIGAVTAWEPGIAVIQAAFMAEPWLRRTLAALPPGLSSLLVGTAATFDDELLAKTGGSYAVQGELDDAVPAVLDEIARGDAGDPSSVPGFVYVDAQGRTHCTPWADGAPQLADRALPHRDLYFEPYPFMGRFPWKRFATGRGCVHSCGFCYLPGLRDAYGDLRPNVRRKSVSRVIEEVLAVRRRWPVERVHFADDLFAPSPKWLEEFADRWPGEIGVEFSCNTSPETVTELNARLLARAGARVVGIGLETGLEESRVEQLGRPTTNQAIRRAASRLKGEGIQLLTFNMIANPGETLDQALETLRLNHELGTDFPRINLAYPLPGGYVEKAMRARGSAMPDLGEHSREEWRAWCAEGDGTPFEILQRLFRLSVRIGLSPELVRRMAELPDRRIFAPLAFYDAWVESRWSGVSPIAALRYARHAGRPNRRVTYHESLP